MIQILVQKKNKQLLYSVQAQKCTQSIIKVKSITLKGSITQTLLNLEIESVEFVQAACKRTRNVVVE